MTLMPTVSKQVDLQQLEEREFQFLKFDYGIFAEDMNSNLVGFREEKSTFKKEILEVFKHSIKLWNFLSKNDLQLATRTLVRDRIKNCLFIHHQSGLSKSSVESH